MKKFTGILCFVFIIFVFFNYPCFAEENIKVFVNAKEISFDIPPTIINGRTMVPLRGIFEALNVNVQWDANTKMVIATKDNVIIRLQVDNKTAHINEKTIELDVPAIIQNGRTLVPVRFISESLQATVEWDGDNNQIKISEKENLRDKNLELHKNTEIRLSDKFYENNEYNFKIILPVGWKEHSKNEETDAQLITLCNENELLGLPMISIISTKNIYNANLDSLMNGLKPELYMQLENLKETSRKLVNLNSQKGVFLELKGELTVNNELNKFYNYMLVTVDNSSNDIHIIMALIPDYLYDLYKEVLRNSLLSFESNEKTLTPTPKNYEISTLTELKDFLEDNFSKLETCIGTTKFSFDINENDRSYCSYDYWIQVGYEYNFFEGAMNSIKYSDEQKVKLRNELKDHQEKLAKAVISAMPNKKFYGGYYTSWYKYPNLKVDLQTRSYFSWKNFDGSIFSEYNTIKPSDFRWYEDLDDKL